MKENKWLRVLAALMFILLVSGAGCHTAISHECGVTDAKGGICKDTTNVTPDAKLDTNITDVQTDTQQPQDTADTLHPKDGIDTSAEDVLLDTYKTEVQTDTQQPQDTADTTLLDAQDVTQFDVADTTMLDAEDMTTPHGPAPVNLGTAGNYVILSKSGITNVPTSAVTGDIGVSPITSTAITGFDLILDASGTFSTSSQVTGHIFAADYASPTPSNLTTAISDMETAYTDAAGRVTPDYTVLGAGNISGLTLVPGLYKWGTGVLISADVTLHGGPNDVWIFQIAEGITMETNTKIILTGGALPKNIFWQSFGNVEIRVGAHFEGIILCSTQIIMQSGASLNGRMLAQTQVTLISNIIVQPAP